MALFKKKSLQEIEDEINRLSAEKHYISRENEIRKLKGEIWSKKVAKAKGILSGIAANAKAVQKEVAKAYTPENEAKVKAMKKVLLGSD